MYNSGCRKLQLCRKGGWATQQIGEWFTSVSVDGFLVASANVNVENVETNKGGN